MLAVNDLRGTCFVDFFCEHSHMRQISDKDVSRLSSLVVGLQDLLARLESQVVKLSPEQEKRIESARKKQVCLKCGHALVAERDTRRGVLHQVCYAQIKRWIKDGKTTEQKATDDGIWNPVPDEPGRKGRYAVIGRNAIKRGTKPLIKVGTNDGTEKS